MSEAPDPPAAPQPNSIIGEAGKWLALIGSVIAAGQAGTTWLRGYWQAEAEKQKSAQELALAELEDKSELAQQYLKVILDKETKPADRAVLHTALGRLDGHPLQKWAQEQYAEYEKNLDKLFKSYKAQSDAAQLRDSTEKQVDLLSADIETLNSQIEIVRDDSDKRQTLQEQRIAKSAELAHARATLSIAAAQVEQTTTIISRSKQGLPVPATANAADAITSISNKITVSLLASAFPESALKNIQTNAPYLQAAFREFKASDKRLAAAIIATSAVESPSFWAYEEPVEAGKAYEDRRDLGNTQPGDGVSRMLVAYFVDRQERLSAALANDNVATVRRITTSNAVTFTSLFWHGDSEDGGTELLSVDDPHVFTILASIICIIVVSDPGLVRRVIRYLFKGELP